LEFFEKHKWYLVGATTGVLLLVVVSMLLSNTDAPNAPIVDKIAAEVSSSESPPAASTATIDFYQEAQQRRAKLLAEKEDREEFKKRLLKKEHSVECRFWKQQQELGKSAKADDKVIEHCTLLPTNVEVSDLAELSDSSEQSDSAQRLDSTDPSDSTDLSGPTEASPSKMEKENLSNLSQSAKMNVIN
jgi:hypothetical protein